MGKSSEMRPTSLEVLLLDEDGRVRRAKRVPDERVSKRMVEAEGWCCEKRA